MNTIKDAIISIHPRYANAILDGQKTIELRRRIPALPIGTKLWIYATLPVGAVIGVATVDRIFRGTPSDIWGRFSNCAGISRADFDSYFTRATEAIALSLTNARRNPELVAIDQLRQLREGFHPPQVMMSINNQEARYLQRLSNAQAA